VCVAHCRACCFACVACAVRTRCHMSFACVACAIYTCRSPCRASLACISRVDHVCRPASMRDNKLFSLINTHEHNTFIWSHILMNLFNGCLSNVYYISSSIKLNICRRFEPGGSLDRRVNCRRVPQPRWVGARRSAKGGRSRRETGVRGEIPRPSCLSRAQVGCACSRGLQASTREGASGLTRAPSRPSPRGQPSVRGPWTFLL
jgi:hypothetical protein